MRRGAKANHLTYLGDATVGAGANIGAGTITCNYDGYFKHRTEIGPRAFIGSNSALIAPVKIGADAIVAAGSAVSRDVADGEVGEIAEAGQILFRIGVLKPLQVVAEVNEEDIPRVAVGQTVLLRTDAFLGQRLEGTVREVTPIGDPVAKTYRIKVALPDDSPLKPGMSLEANIITREKPGALLVPADAVQGSVVFVVDVSRSVPEHIVDMQLQIASAYLAHVPDAHAEVVVFDRRARRLFGAFLPAKDFADAVAKARKSGGLGQGNGSALEDGLETAAAALDGRRGPTRIVSMTDAILRTRFRNAIAIRALTDLPKGSVVHVVIPEDDMEASLRRDDAQALGAGAK